jgi:UDP-galactopyranose mutase
VCRGTSHVLHENHAITLALICDTYKDRNTLSLYQIMTVGPFSSAAGIGRAEPAYARLNKVVEECGVDDFATKSEVPPPLSSDTSTLPANVDVLIIGSGLSGSVFASRCSEENLTCAVLEARSHIGGNCFDFIDETSDLRISKYGAHLFHTQSDRVWKYVQRFSRWMPFDHRVRGLVDGKLVPIPPTMETVNALFGTAIDSEEEMEDWYKEQRVVPSSEDGVPRNGEEAALSRVGPQLYEKIFKHYTKKQWNKYPEELDASVLLRLPCRSSKDDRYFNDVYQGKCVSLSSQPFNLFLSHCTMKSLTLSFFSTTC